MAAKGFKVLTDDQVAKIQSVEANGMGSGVLPALIDKALDPAQSGATAAAAAQATANTAVTNAATAQAAAVAAQTTATAAAPRAKFVAYDVAVPAGSPTPAAIAVAGLLATDLVLGLTQKTANVTGIVPIEYSIANGLLTVVYAADPGANGIVHLAVLKV